MIIADGRVSTRVTDLLLTRPLINKSRLNLVLTHNEASAVKQNRIKSKTTILPNGIAIPSEVPQQLNLIRRVTFCSRLDKRKGVEKFINLAETFKESNLVFEIYGPDNGELELVENEIQKRNIGNVLKYGGPLPSSEVPNMLQEVDLLILPSKDEPFPMVILESLAVGTPVLVMPSCGIANQLADFEATFVAKSEDQNGINYSFQKLLDDSFQIKPREAIRAFCTEKFGISSVVDQLLHSYRRALLNE